MPLRAGPGGDLRRVIDGIALIAAESVRRSASIRAATSGDLPALLAAAVNATADLTGLTCGRPRRFNSSRGDSPRPSSVVYFSHADVDKPAVDTSERNAKRGQEDSLQASVGLAESSNEAAAQAVVEEEKRYDAAAADGNGASAATSTAATPAAAARPRRPLRERRVPSTPFSRALGFAGLGAGLAWGTVQESAKRLVFGNPQSADGGSSAFSPFLSEQNAERLALALCRMRGAALKIGQMLSIQDESLIPPPILAALEIVRQGADVMPKSQLNAVLDAELGIDWPSKLKLFDYEPLAAASIGQVHRAVTKDGLEVAMKIQYPGVAESIESDIENVRLLLNYTNLIPKGLFLDRAIKVAKEELSRECDYLLEARNQKRFKELIANCEGFYVPRVIDEITSRKVITTELVKGIPIDKVSSLNQETRNYAGRKLLELTLKELFVFRFMQTDPNWSNFLYDESTKVFNLIDFGAAREYPKSFVDDYLRMVVACADRDRSGIIELSRRLGFITGDESEVMLDAHVQAALIVGLPFSKAGGYDFVANNITGSVSNLGATMLKHRLTPPPDEAYSLHRKLSGAFLACIKLRAVVPCRDLLMEVYNHYRFDDSGREALAGAV